MSDAKRDQNFVPTALGVSSVDSVTPVPFKVDPVTGRLLTDNAGGGAPSDQLINLMSTGLLTGGTLISINADPTKFDVAAFTYQIVDNSVPTAPVYTEYPFAGQTGITATYLAGYDATYITIGAAGTILQSPIPPTATEKRTYAQIGAIIHQSHTSIDLVVNATSNVSINQSANIEDLAGAIGSINSGNVYSANGANLNLNKSAGTTYGSGINWGSNTSNPNNTTDASQTALTFIYSWQDGSGGFNTATTTSIVPGEYDDGTGGVGTPNGSVSTNRWSVQRIYWSPLTAQTAIAYGQATYNTAAEAEAARDDTVVSNPIFAALTFRGWLIVRGGATTLNTSSNAIFIEADKFGQTTGGSGTGSSTTTLQQAYNNSTTPEIVTDVTRDGFTLKNGYGTDTNINFENQNLAGTTTASILANGTTKALTFIPDATTTVTAAGTTTLTATSSPIQEFTGSTTQTVTMPVVSTLVLGQQYQIVNNSTGAVTVTASGGGTIAVLPNITALTLTVRLITGTTAASWNTVYAMRALGTGIPAFLDTPTSANLAAAVTDETGSGALVFATSPTLVTPALGTPTSGVLTNCTFPTLNQDTTGKSAKTDALNSATTVVNVSSATAPTTGQVLTATSSTAATWQTPSITATRDFNVFEAMDGTTTPVAVTLGSDGSIIKTDANSTATERKSFLGFMKTNQASVDPAVLGSAVDTTSTTQSFTANSGNNRVILIFAAVGDNSSAATLPSAFTWNSLSFTSITSIASNANLKMQIWALAIGDSGSNQTFNVVRTGGSGANYNRYQIVCLSNVNQSSPASAFSSAVNAAGNPSATITAVQVYGKTVISQASRIGTANITTSGVADLIVGGSQELSWVTNDGNVSLTGGSGSSENAIIGVSLKGVNATQATVYYTSIVSGFSGLTIGAKNYVSDTAGLITTTAPATVIPVGIAISATEILIKTAYPN